ncbi:MAG: hypothetical protein ACN6OU_05460 [Stenotrophomonas acidaminiphila]
MVASFGYQPGQYRAGDAESLGQYASGHRVAFPQQGKQIDERSGWATGHGIGFVSLRFMDDIEALVGFQVIALKGVLVDILEVGGLVSLRFPG